MSTATKEYTQKRRIGIVCTVGTRDLTLDGQTAEKLGKAGNTEFASPRKLGKEILDDWDNLSKRIAFPIIQPVIDSAFERARSSQGEIVYLLLVGTDQPTLIEETHREKDTAYFTEVAVNYYSQQSQRPSKSFQAKRLLYPMNPTRMDIAWNYLQQKASKECFTELRNCDQVFLSTTGGVPGLNQALLMFLFSEVCGRNLSFVHVDEDLQRPIPIEIVQHLTRLETIHRIEAYVETFDFAAMARELLEEDQEGDHRYRRHPCHP
ncbi:MAG TPA: hypothetical protein PKO06_03175, partial [Candidatus Ozemobacteraceae bacterium]|nr:hypothetical protein [Candidatus Ozemobacteraceae bacterium]